MSGFPSKIICSYGLTDTKGDVSFMSFSVCLMLRLLLLEKHKVILTSFLMTLRSSSRFTIRNCTGDTKKMIVKYSGCNMSLHKPAASFLCSVFMSPCLPQRYSGLSPDSPPSIPSPQRTLSGRFICSCGL